MIVETDISANFFLAHCACASLHCAVVAGVAAAARSSALSIFSLRRSPALCADWPESVYTSTELLWTTWVSYSVSIKWSFVKDLKKLFFKKTRQITLQEFSNGFFEVSIPNPSRCCCFVYIFIIWWKIWQCRKIIRENSVC